jgi:TPR repeat protein
MTIADPTRALELYSKSCELRFQAACINLLNPTAAMRGDPHLLDLRLLLREGGRNLLDMSEPDLYARACKHGFAFACHQGN